MGAGKSKLLNKVVEHYTTPEIYADLNVIPIYVSSRALFTKAEVKRPLGAITNERCGDFSTNKDKTFLFLIDGLDEANIKTDDERAFLEEIIAEVYNDTRYKAVITSRPFSDDNTEYLISRKTERYELRPLTLNKIVNFISDICKSLNARIRLIEDLKKSTLFKVLPRTPIAAILLARLLNEQQEELPASLTELYTKYIELSLGRWDHSRGLATHKEFEAKIAILSKMAKFMLDNQAFCISRAEAMGFFEEYLKERNLKLYASDLFVNILERSDILAKDSNNELISFKHKSFADYFYARYLFNSNQITLTPKIFHPYWVNVYFFLLGIKGDCPGLILDILSIPTETEGVRFSRFVNMGNFLLAAHKTPYTYITDALLSVFMDAGLYFSEIIDGKIKSALSRLPPMHLLAILRCLLSDSYSYTFFKEAITEGIDEIYTRSKIDNNAAYSLFFLDVARAEVGGERIFDRLAGALNDELPLAIQLAIGHETNGKTISMPIKKMEKRLRKNCRSSRAYNQAVHQLYNESIEGKKLPTKEL